MAYLPIDGITEEDIPLAKDECVRMTDTSDSRMLTMGINEICDYAYAKPKTRMMLLEDGRKVAICTGTVLIDVEAGEVIAFRAVAGKNSDNSLYPAFAIRQYCGDGKWRRLTPSLGDMLDHLD